MQAMQAIESVECNKQTDDRYNLRLTDRQLRERDTLLCNEKRVREVYHGELSRALEEVRNSIANL